MSPNKFKYKVKYNKRFDFSIAIIRNDVNKIDKINNQNDQHINVNF